MPMPPSWLFFLGRIRAVHPTCLGTICIRRIHLAIVCFLVVAVVSPRVLVTPENARAACYLLKYCRHRRPCLRRALLALVSKDATPQNWYAVWEPAGSAPLQACTLRRRVQQQHCDQRRLFLPDRLHSRRNTRA